MTTDFREQSAFWYIVLQPVVLKNESNIPVLDLTSHMMILVEKLWVIGPDQVLAKVVYPAEGYVPLEGSTCGKLIARLDPRGPQVPEEQLEIKQQETYHKLAALGNQTKCCLSKHYVNRFSPGELQAPNHRHNVWPGMIASSYTKPLLGNTFVGGALLCPQNDNQRAQFQSNPGLSGPVEVKHDSNPVNYLPGGISGFPNVSNPYATKGSRYMFKAGQSSWSSDPTELMSGNLLPYDCISRAYKNRKTEHFKSGYSEYQAEGFNNFSNPHSHDLINSDVKIIDTVDIKGHNSGGPKFPSRRNFRQCLLSLYHSIDRPAETWDSDTDKKEERHSTVSAEQLSIAKTDDDEKSDMVPLLKHRKKWRYEPNRWITVSALCHELLVMCRRNKYKSGSSNFKPCTIFQTDSIPDISLPAYLKRIAWYLGCPTACFVLALEYIYRLSHLCPEVELNEYSVHQIVITCIMVATKFIDDKLFKNKFYARIAGVPVTNLSAFEVRLIFFLKFDLRVLPEQYVARCESMLRDNQGPNMVIIQPDGIDAEGDAN